MTFKDLRLTWTDCDETEDCAVPNVLSPRDLVFRPDIMDETVTSSSFCKKMISYGEAILDLLLSLVPKTVYKFP